MVTGHHLLSSFFSYPLKARHSVILFPSLLAIPIRELF